MTKTRVRGTLFRVFDSRKPKNKTIYDFIVKSNGNELKVSKFSSGVDSLLGEEVEFDAQYNEQYDRYTVVGDVVQLAQTSSTAHVAADSEATPVKAPQPSRTRKHSTSNTVKSTVIDSDRAFLESVREDAEAIAHKDYLFAKTLFDNDGAQALLIQALQSIRATLVIRKDKDRRVSEMRSR